MLKRTGLISLSLVACMMSAVMTIGAHAAPPQALTVDQIIQKNIAARGGLQAWHEIQTMTLTGKMEAGTKDNVQLPFVLKLKRPKMSRLELQFGGKTALQIYDGQNGWKVRPFLGRNEVEPFTAAELEKAGEEEQMEGPLIDHEAKGIQVELEGVEPVEGHDAYKLKLTLRDGKTHHLWVDAQSFLEVKAEGFPRVLDGKPHNVEVYYRNYKPAGSVTVPYVLETIVAGVKQTHKITIDTYVLNSKLEDSAFVEPDLPGGIVPAAAPRGAAPPLPADAIKKGGQNEKSR